MADEKKIKKEFDVDTEHDDNYMDASIEYACHATNERQDGAKKRWFESGIGDEQVELPELGELDTCRKKLAETQENYLHAIADLHNFQQRVQKERGNWSITAQADVLKKLLPIVDDFDRALQEADKLGRQGDQLIAGFAMIHKALLKMLSAAGVEIIADVSVFDPEKHEAVMQVDVPGYESGAIVEVLEKGYLFKHEVIRPAKVTVAR